MKTVFDRLLCFGAACAFFTTSSMAAAPEPLSLKPSGKWTVDYQPDGCRLLRQFGEGENKSFIIISRYAPSDSFGLTLVGKPYNINSSGKANIQFGPTEAIQTIDFFAGETDVLPSLLAKRNMGISSMSSEQYNKLGEAGYLAWRKAAPEREKLVEYVTVGKPLRRAVKLETGPLDKPMAALANCIDNLVASWGLDVEKHKSLTRWVTPINDKRLWMTSDDYPSKMNSTGQPALVYFRLDIDEAGKVTGCHIQQTTRPKEFDDAVCKGISKRAKLLPALDAGGKPLKSYYHDSVRFDFF